MKQEIITKKNTFNITTNDKVVKLLIEYWESRNFDFQFPEEGIFIGRRYPRVRNSTLFNLPAELEISIRPDCIISEYSVYVKTVSNPLANFTLFEREMDKAQYFIELGLLNQKILEKTKVDSYSNGAKRKFNALLVGTFSFLAFLDLAMIFITLGRESSSAWGAITQYSLIFATFLALEFVVIFLIKKMKTEKLARYFIKLQLRYLNQVVRPIQKLKSREKKPIDDFLKKH